VLVKSKAVTIQYTQQPHTIRNDYTTLPALESMNRKTSMDLGMLQIHSSTIRKNA